MVHDGMWYNALCALIVVILCVAVFHSCGTRWCVARAACNSQHVMQVALGRILMVHDVLR